MGVGLSLVAVCWTWCLGTALTWTLHFLFSWRVYRSFDTLEPDPAAGETGPQVSAIVPARNEAEGLERSLRSLLAQAGVELQVIVVNDHSTDGTGAIADRVAAGDARVHVLHDPPLPPGWLGKCNALHCGAALATGAYLLFTDADTDHRPGSLAAAVAELERGDYAFLTLLPRLRYESVWEHTALPLLAVGLAWLVSPRMEAADADRVMGAGAFSLMRADAYRRVGGHAAIRDAVADDVELARLVKRHGLRVGARRAPRCVQVRMYTSARTAFWAYSKNILAGFGRRPWLALPAMLGYNAWVWAGPGAVVAGLGLGSPALAAAGTVLYVGQALSFVLFRDLFAARPLGLLAFPLSGVSFMCSTLVALYYWYVKGGVHWRGRTLRVGQSS